MGRHNMDYIKAGHFQIVSQGTTSAIIGWVGGGNVNVSGNSRLYLDSLF